VLPSTAARWLLRWKNVLVGIAFYEFCQRYPARARRWLMAEVQKQVGPDCDVHTHFNPRYDPWDERVCMVPDGDLFAAIKRGDVEVVTDQIERFTEAGIQLRSGRALPADLVITATGLELQFLGGATASIDGAPVEWGQHMLYKGMMLSDVPNAAFCVGYSNASWTLKVELTCAFITGLLRRMDERGATICYPPREAGVAEAPPMDLDSGYIRRAEGRMPVQGERRPWRLYQNYVLDKIGMRPSRIDDGSLVFKPQTPP
jgi:cation diffusion facilitator CzcD-associated flavoprotein CzcO